MKVAVTTDLHAGFGEGTRRVHEKFFAGLQKEEFDVLLITGDLISNQQKQMESIFKCLRLYFPDKEIMVVYGNHDYWDWASWNKGGRQKNRYPFHRMEQYHEELCLKYDITYLQDNPRRFKDGNREICFFGYDGWYNSVNPLSNDHFNLPKEHQCVPIHQYLRYRADKAVDKIIEEVDSMDITDRVFVCATHFNLYLNDIKYLTMCGMLNQGTELFQRFDYIFCGHTHQQYSQIMDGCIVKNIGTNYDEYQQGYNNPRYEIVDL